MQALLNGPEHEAIALLKQIRTCENLDVVAQGILSKSHDEEEDGDEEGEEGHEAGDMVFGEPPLASPTFETHLSTKMGELRVEEGTSRYIGGTSNLLFLDDGDDDFDTTGTEPSMDPYQHEEDPITSWTEVTKDANLIKHLLRMYFTWHYTYFTTLSRNLFLKDFYKGRGNVAAGLSSRKTEYCTPLLVNAMLALGCHFTALPAARAQRDDSSTAGNHFFNVCLITPPQLVHWLFLNGAQHTGGETAHHGE
jgi:hypothetical protein